MARLALKSPAFVALGLLLALPGAPAALAGQSPPSPPQDVSAISQYVETLPTSAGPRTLGSGSGDTPLSAAAAQKVSHEGGSDAKTLVKVATSGRLGAPESGTGRPTSSLLSKLDRYTTPTFVAGVGAAVDWTGSVSGLAVVLLVLTAAAGAGAARRRMRTPHPG